MVRSAWYRQKENEDQEIIGLIAMGNVQYDIKFALCIENKDCDDLEKGKVYQILSDDTAAQEGYLRVVDESTEDYLYPESYFVVLDLPKRSQDALLMGA